MGAAPANRWQRWVYLGSQRVPSLEPVFVGPRGSEKDQAELAYLDFVAVGQDCRLHRLTVDIGAVEAADVDDLEFAVPAPELGVPSRSTLHPAITGDYVFTLMTDAVRIRTRSDGG